MALAKFVEISTFRNQFGIFLRRWLYWSWKHLPVLFDNGPCFLFLSRIGGCERIQRELFLTTGSCLQVCSECNSIWTRASFIDSFLFQEQKRCRSRSYDRASHITLQERYAALLSSRLFLGNTFSDLCSWLYLAAITFTKMAKIQTVFQHPTPPLGNTIVFCRSEIMR